jgi:thiol:disulfide interchange protein/DsbC/DsbD-like thiol-disulfide interchange protein
MLPHPLRVALFLIALLCHFTPGFAQILAKSVVTTPEVRAELLAHAPQGLPRDPGQAAAHPVWLGLKLVHQPHWHTYWKNPGDSGLPTTLEWTLPPGVQAGEIVWPAPKKLPVPPLVNYGYDGTVLLPVPLRFTADYRAPASGKLDVRVKASWLVCRQECIPQEGEFALSLPLEGSVALHGAEFEAAFDAAPTDLASRALTRARVEGERLQLRITGLPEAWRGLALDVFPETPEVLESASTEHPQATQRWAGEVWEAAVPLSKDRSSSPEQLPLVLSVREGRSAPPKAVRILAAVEGGWPAARAAATVSPALEAALQANAANAASGAAPAAPGGGADIGLVAALLGAFLGGLILNLMPCVFPVLAIKVLAFAQHADDRRAHRISGLAYTVGVVVSFVALGALLLALRAAGESLGWGFQLQNPWVVAALATLFTVIGLNLAGLFEFGSVLPSSLASLHARHPVADAFLTGMLAVAVASPCTAPFMGASLGFAVALPGVQALAVFASIGLGLALPYLVAAFSPAVARALPRPGAWMDTFRHLMAFPMFATVVWLVWVLGQQSGIDGAAALLALLVALAFIIWAFTLQGRARWTLVAVALALFAWTASAFGPRVGQMETTSLSDTGATPNAAAADGAPVWEPWAPGKVESIVASGQAVFVDFTAAWCVTCQYNKKTTLANPAVLADLRAKNVRLLRADWTRRDPAITAELARLGRNGVPVYVLHPPGKPPVVLSELLSVDEVLAALARL